LSIFGSVLAFGAYLSLIGRVGADRAAYATIVFPIVALLISSIFEGYHWPIEAIIGITLVAAGNLLLLDKALLKRMQLFLSPAKRARPPSTPTES
jgi:drug/metabolite transporter (DMT)-like permease